MNSGKLNIKPEILHGYLEMCILEESEESGTLNSVLEHLKKNAVFSNIIFPDLCKGNLKIIVFSFFMRNFERQYCVR